MFLEIWLLNAVRPRRGRIMVFIFLTIYIIPKVLMFIKNLLKYGTTPTGSNVCWFILFVINIRTLRVLGIEPFKAVFIFLTIYIIPKGFDVYG